MKDLSRNQRGSLAVAIVFVIVALAVLGLAGYYVVTSHTEKDDVTQTHAVPRAIESKSDLEQAAKAVDSGDIDSELDPGQLDDDLSDLL